MAYCLCRLLAPSVGVNPDSDSDSDSMGESESDSAPMDSDSDSDSTFVDSDSSAVDSDSGLMDSDWDSDRHPGGLGLIVSPDESGEKYTRHIFKLLCAIMDKIREEINQIQIHLGVSNVIQDKLTHYAQHVSVKLK